VRLGLTTTIDTNIGAASTVDRITVLGLHIETHSAPGTRFNILPYHTQPGPYRSESCTRSPGPTPSSPAHEQMPSDACPSLSKAIGEDAGLARQLGRRRKTALHLLAVEKLGPNHGGNVEGNSEHRGADEADYESRFFVAGVWRTIVCFGAVNVV